LRSLFMHDLSSWHSCDFIKSSWFEPSVSHLKLSFYLFPHEMHVVY
jgi:hypothetical protein